MHFLRIRSVFIGFLAVLISLPVLALMGSWLEWNSSTAQVLQEMLQTVLPNYMSTSLWLCIGVALGVSLVGTMTAAAITLFKLILTMQCENF